MTEYVSVTDLTAYQWCPRAVFIRKVLKLREPVKPVMVMGSIRHKVFEDANRKEEQLVKRITPGMEKHEVLGMFGTAYSHILNTSVYNYSAQLEALRMDKNVVTEELQPVVADQAAARAHEILQFADKEKVFGKELWNALTPKIISEMSVASKNLRLRGIIDRIMDYGTEYVVAEIKTGRVPNEGVWPDHRLQLSAYMMLLKDKFRAEIKEGLVLYVKNGVTRQVLFNPFMEHEVITAVRNVFALLEERKLPGFCGKSFCGVCNLGDDFEQRLEPVAFRH